MKDNVYTKKDIAHVSFEIGSLILFIAYQVYRYTLTQSIFLILLTIFDIIMIGLTYLEYKRINAEF